MWNELVEIFKGEDPLQGLADQFMQLLGHARSMIETVQPFVAGRTLDEATWQELLATDNIRATIMMVILTVRNERNNRVWTTKTINRKKFSNKIIPL